MKKLVLILALMLIPCTAFGLQMMDDSSMDGITGQSGVSVAFDDVQLFINIGKLAWIDCDGLDPADIDSVAGTCPGGAGAIGLNNFQIDVLNVNAIVNSDTPDPGEIQTESTANGNPMELYSAACGQVPLFYDYGDTTIADTCHLSNSTAAIFNTAGLDNYTHLNTTGTNTFRASPLTIDATSEMPVMTAITVNNDDTNADATFGGVVIGIPTMEIHIQSMTLTPYFTADINEIAAADLANVVNEGEDFGTIYFEEITFTTLSGWLEIGPH